MARYRLLTTWLLEAPRPQVWDVLQDVRAWPQWWEGAESVVELDAGDHRRVGSRYRVRWRGRVPYAVEIEFVVDVVRQPALMEGRSSGALVGAGRWRLFEEAGVTAVTYEWDVRTSPRWMNAAAPLARPLLTANHDWVMRRGGEGLAGRLGARLLAGG